MSHDTQISGLSCRRITKAFPTGGGVFDVTFEVPPGTAYALLGGNGAGKTTLINVLLGYLLPDSGEAFIGGIDVSRDAVGARGRLAYVPEVARLYPNLSAIENVRFFERLMGRDRRPDDVTDVLSILDFPLGAASDPARTYSKGMRQKVVIAMGLLKGAGVFLLDEPTSGLDPGGVATFARLVTTLKASGKAILFSSHDLQSVYACAGTAGILHRGRLLSEQPVERLRETDVLELFRQLQAASDSGTNAGGSVQVPVAEGSP